MDVLTRVRALCHRLPLGEASRAALRLLKAELAAAGVSPGLVRLSVGLEDPRDLIEDLRLGLDRLG